MSMSLPYDVQQFVQQEVAVGSPSMQKGSKAAVETQLADACTEGGHRAKCRWISVAAKGGLLR